MKTNILSRWFVATALVALPAWVHAQGDNQSKWTITPRVGMTLSTITYNNSNIDLFESRVGFGGGVEAEYHLSKIFGLSLGTFYTTQGAKLNSETIYATDYKGTAGPDNPYSLNITTVGKGAPYDISDYTDDFELVERIYDEKLVLGYVNVPLMVNAHLLFNLPVNIAVKAGAQLDILVSGKNKAKSQLYYGKVYTSKGLSKNVKDDVKDFGLTIPAGLAVSYKNFEIDARYLWNVSDINDVDGFKNKSTNHNSTFFLTLGYNFNL